MQPEEVERGGGVVRRLDEANTGKLLSYVAVLTFGGLNG